MLKIKYIFVILIIVFVHGYSPGQGCSDAGACSIGGVHDDAAGSRTAPKIKVTLGQSFALGEKFVFISQTSLSFEHRFLKHTSYVVNVPFIFTSGNLGNSTGVGDVLVSFIQQLYSNGESTVGLLVGGRLRSNNSNFTFAGNPLPMAYQTSLGTYDVIGGLQYVWKSWDFYLAYQHPFGRNQNQYLHPPGETDPDKLYFESAHLKRGDDLAFRLRKTFGLKKQQNLQTGFLSIYRLQKSQIIKNDQSVILNGTNGLTLNLFLTYQKTLKDKTKLYFTAAFPVVDRAYRADGLTRNFVFNIRVTQFW